MTLSTEALCTRRDADVPVGGDHVAGSGVGAAEGVAGRALDGDAAPEIAEGSPSGSRPMKLPAMVFPPPPPRMMTPSSKRVIASPWIVAPPPSMNSPAAPAPASAVEPNANVRVVAFAQRVGRGARLAVAVDQHRTADRLWRPTAGPPDSSAAER